MKKILKSVWISMMTVCMTGAGFSLPAVAQTNMANYLSGGQEAIIAIAALTAKGDLEGLKSELNAGLDAGLTINQIKEVLVHVYAYCGFPRSIRGLQTFMTVLEVRKTRGLQDQPGPEASPISDDQLKYDRGKAVLDSLTGAPQNGPATGYAAFAPVIEIFLKEHLFADIFERDVLRYTQRELATVSVLASIGGVEPMLQSHLKICMNEGLTAGQLQQFTAVIRKKIGKKQAKSARQALSSVLSNGN